MKKSVIVSVLAMFITAACCHQTHAQLVRLLEERLEETAEWKEGPVEYYDEETGVERVVTGMILEGTINNIYVKIKRYRNALLEVYVKDLKTGFWFSDVYGNGVFNKYEGDRCFDADSNKVYTSPPRKTKGEYKKILEKATDM